MVDVLADVTGILRDLLHDQNLQVTLQTRFGDIAGWDSMDLITAVVEVECLYDLQFDLQDIDRLVTVGDLVDLVFFKRTLTAA